jgi:hypothetical protein
VQWKWCGENRPASDGIGGEALKNGVFVDVTCQCSDARGYLEDALSQLF